ncbi:MAG: response regulator [Desulfobacterales bacterium]|nr:response regulator [Desulfobacterales bacterium]
MNIIIVDDDRGNLNALKAHLSRYGHRVRTANRGQIALEKIARADIEGRPLDLLVTDLKMPGMNGIELLRSVNTQWPQMAKVLMTAYGGHRIRESALHLCAEYIEKPFSPELLLKKMDRFQETGGGNHVEKP